MQLLLLLLLLQLFKDKLWNETPKSPYFLLVALSHEEWHPEEPTVPPCFGRPLWAYTTGTWWLWRWRWAGLGYTIEIWQNWRIQHGNINGNLWKYRMTHDDICFTKWTSDLGLVPEKWYSHWLYGNETLGKMWLETIIFLWMEVFWYHIFRQSHGTMCDRKFISKNVVLVTSQCFWKIQLESTRCRTFLRSKLVENEDISKLDP